MECFNDLLLKLREAHEREVEGWQIKVQELSNKKGCDTKRMEELFTRNQQMKEQQRLLTENIKTLENRLRAGLCDRCTVTEEFANRRQQEFEASQIQTLQRISQMVAEITNLKKENKRLREEKEIRSLRAAPDHSDHSANSITEVKSSSSPEFSPSSGPEAVFTVTAGKANSQPSDGDVGVKTEREQRPEEVEHRQLRGISRSHCESYKPLSLSPLTAPSWRTEHSATRVGERRAHGINGLDQRSSIAPQSLLLKNSSSSTSGLNLGRHVLHTPVPCRPQPIRGSPISFPWPLSESPDWVNLATAGTNPVMQPPSKPNMPRFPNLIPTSQHASSRRQVFGSPWPKSSSPQSTAKEPTVVFRFRNLPEHHESQIKPQEKQENQPPKAESVSSGEELQDPCEGPLDLSDRGKSKSSQTSRTDSPIAFQGEERVHMSPDNASTNPPAYNVVSSPSPVSLPSSSSTPPVKHQDNCPTSDPNPKVIDSQEHKEEVNGKTEQGSEKRVPVLTISLRPVVVLETLNSALQKQESLSSNGKSSTSAAEPGSSSEEQDEETSTSSQESSQGCKRKRASVETETNRDSDTDNIQHEKNGSEEPQQKRMIPR